MNLTRKTTHLMKATPKTDDKPENKDDFHDGDDEKCE